MRVLKIFDPIVIEFLNKLSKSLMRYTNYPDVVTLGFWCRKANILRLSQEYQSIDNIRIGRGTIFHIAPANVAVNFAYSLIAGLLAGNANIVRLPSKQFAQIDIICNEISNLLDGGFIQLKQYIQFVSYQHDKVLTDKYSALCDTRVIWGGDNTISEVRSSPLKPRANEITFADRHSICVINAEDYLQLANKKQLATDFYNDTYLSDQNACTSPRIVVWIGDNDLVTIAQEIFWDLLHEVVKDNYTLTPVQAVGKLAALCKYGAVAADINMVAMPDNLITRVRISEISSETIKFKYNSGYFLEYSTNDLDDILPLCESKCQTVCYFGNVDFKEYIYNCMPSGIDRVVPIGKSLDFSLVWDGYDLIYSMSRVITLFKG